MRVSIFSLLLAAACATASAQSTPAPLTAVEPPPDAGAADAPPVAPPPSDAAPEAPPVPQPGLEADVSAARAALAQGDVERARAMLQGVLARQPSGPLRASASVLLARADLLRGDAAGARDALAPLGAAAPAEVRALLGVAELRLGHAAAARDLLQGLFDGRDVRAPAGMAASPDDAAQELRGALAEALSGTGDAAAALRLWDVYLRAGRDPERALARQRAGELAARAAAEDAARIYAAAPDGSLARAALGPRAAARARAQNDASGAATIEAQSAAARRALGFEESGPRTGPGDPRRLGVALPFSGRFQPVGEAALRGIMTAAGVPAAAAVGPNDPQLCVRDSGSEPERAVAAVAELVSREAVVGIVGTAERKASAAAQAEAARQGVPLLVLDDQVPGAVSTAYQMIHSPERRAAELARRALRLGVRTFAILGPDSALGKRLGDAFRAEVEAGGGRITAEVTYVNGATSFAKQVAAVKSSQPQAVFVPDTAQKLELVAPALAFADLWPQVWAPPSGKPGKAPARNKPRNILLLSTAHDLSERLLASAGRYVQGALLAPGFYADSGEPRAAAFMAAYRAAFNQDPHSTEAYAHDAMTVLRTAVGRGARTRAELMQRLGQETFPALTGEVRFGPDHARIDPPVVYEVTGDEIHLLK